jgi:Tol biopolymer transport system component
VCSQIAVISALVVVTLALPCASASAASPATPGETFPASVTPEGEWADGEGTGEYTPVSISADGRYVAFESAATNLGEGGPAEALEGFVKDLDSGQLQLVTRADGTLGEPAGEPGIEDLKLSADGRYVIFTSAATNLGTVLPGEEPSEQHVYRRDLQSGKTILIDRVSGAEGTIFSRGAKAEAISADGRYVVFADRVNGLEDPSADHTETGGSTVYVRDTQTETTVAVSRASGASGEFADEPSEAFSISADGRYVAFASRATNLVPGMEGNIWEQVYLRDLQSTTTTLVSQNALGEAGDRSSGLPVLVGDDGCEVELSSIAFNLLEPSSLEVSGEQVYVENHCASPATMTLVSQDENGIAGFAYSFFGGSADGRYVLFAAEFQGSSGIHLYQRDLQTEQISQLDRASGASGASANAEVEQAAISANGCRAVFGTRATNLYGAGPPEGPGGEEPSEAYVRQLAPCVTSSEEPAAQNPSNKGASSARPRPTAAAGLRIVSLSQRKLVLSLSGPGRVSIRVRRFAEEPRRHWRFLRTIAMSVAAPGRIDVPLVDLPPDRYRLNVHLHRSQAAGIVRLLTID